MELIVSQDETNGDWICELSELTEAECDVARNNSVGMQALSAGAIGWGTSYRSKESEYEARVRARERQTALDAAEAYYTAIRDAIESESE